jgi:hypothetical protein
VVERVGDIVDEGVGDWGKQDRRERGRGAPFGSRHRGGRHYVFRMTTPTTSVPALLALLQQERAQLLATFESIPEADRTRPGGEPGRGSGWSAAQIIEHCARVEGNVARMIAKGAELPRTATAEELQAGCLTETSIGWVRDHTKKVEAPERVRPVVPIAAADALALLLASRTALLAAFTAADPAVLDGILFPHPFVGPLTLRSWTELVAHHEARHAEQLAALRRR